MPVNLYALELTRLPTTSVKVLLRLAKTLLRDKPAQTNQVILTAAERLEAMIGRVNKALVARLIALNPELIASEVEFDRAVDALWLMLRRSLELRTAYANPGLDALSEELAAQADLPGAREEAREAARLWSRLFASDGTSFTRSSYVVQAESMATLLNLIAQEQLREGLVAVVGARPVELLEACQQQYETMIAERLNRKSGASENLNELRSELRWAIVAYVQAVHSLYDPAAPESAQLVLDALRPILVMREAVARTSASGGGEPLLEGFVELDELAEPEPSPEQEPSVELEDDAA